ncbi:MAG TPA: hypothetical protein VMA34_15580 [Terracidiphilus sp.]|nr:hypothetical protein [Terracidiphilus sp.]
MSGRVDPFAILKEPTAFTTKPKPEKRVEENAIDDIARQNNFPSRQAPKKTAAPKREQRRYRTGRNRHLGVKATAETVERFYKAADNRNVPLGEVLRLALDALERAGGSS